LKEYPKAAQEKKVTADLVTPASLSHRDSEEKISSIGIPAERPRKSMVITEGLVKSFNASSQLLVGVSGLGFDIDPPL
tara:strand:- start:1409 stop:1642 length:234 start_codon:yes stop_codon:yes gene_type:complete